MEPREEEQEQEQDSDPGERMVGDASEPNSEFKLKFDGRLNEVNANTLGYSLVYVSTIIREIRFDLSSRIEIRVKSTAPGSFIVGLTLEALNDPLFQAHLASAGTLALTVIDTLTKLFNLRKALKGEPPKNVTPVEGGNVGVTARDNAKVVIDNRTFKLYFTTPEVNEALSKTFQTLDSDKSIEGFESATPKKTLYFKQQATSSRRWPLPHLSRNLKSAKLQTKRTSTSLSQALIQS
jgi:hypothetical protein